MSLMERVNRRSAISLKISFSLLFFPKEIKNVDMKQDWIVHVTQVVERLTLNINMASVHMLTLSSFMVFIVSNAVNRD